MASTKEYGFYILHSESMKDYDLNFLYFADPRFTGGTTSSIANEIKALKQKKIAPGVCPVLSSVFPGPRPFHEFFTNAAEENDIFFIPASSKISVHTAIVHHPRIFETFPSEQIHISVKQLILVIHHPPFNGVGLAEYDLEKIIHNLYELFRRKITLAPVSPIIRDQLLSFTSDKTELLDKNWYNLIDLKEWHFRSKRALSDQIIIGRHSRPQLSKWPATREEAVLAYPEKTNVRIKMLGAPPELSNYFKPKPINWELLEFSTDRNVRSFLQEIDFYVYYHSHEWIEAFGYCILEAIVSGVLVILPKSFKPLFGPAAIYSTPKNVWKTIKHLSNDNASYIKHTKQAYSFIKEKFDIKNFIPRLDLYGVPLKKQKHLLTIIPKKPPQRILMMTSNGVGLGHLTRAMAILDRFPPNTKTAIFTLSQGFQLAVKQGILTQFVPFHRLTGAPNKQWNTALAEEVNDFIAFFKPNIIVFDGNTPYSGLIDALNYHPHIKSVWLRRALWGKDSKVLKQRSKRFDLIIEPEEFSGRFDEGATSKDTNGVIIVPPILNINPKSRLSFKEARKSLKITYNKIVIAMMLGAGNNFEFSTIRGILISQLKQYQDVELIEIIPPIKKEKLDESNHRQIELYPAYRYSQGFDIMITSAGYNTFHENLLGGIPTLFIPNEAFEMDRQLLRAKHASLIGYAEILRANDRINIKEKLDRLLDANEREKMKQRMAVLQFDDGAKVAARLIHQLSFALRAKTPL